MESVRSLAVAELPKRPENGELLACLKQLEARCTRATLSPCVPYSLACHLEGCRGAFEEPDCYDAS